MCLYIEYHRINAATNQDEFQQHGDGLFSRGSPDTTYTKCCFFQQSVKDLAHVIFDLGLVRSCEVIRRGYQLSNAPNVLVSLTYCRYV